MGIKIVFERNTSTNTDFQEKTALWISRKWSIFKTLSLIHTRIFWLLKRHACLGSSGIQDLFSTKISWWLNISLDLTLSSSSCTTWYPWFHTAVWVKGDGVQKSEMIVLLKLWTLPNFLCNAENMIHCSLNQFKGTLPCDNEDKSVQSCFFPRRGRLLFCMSPVMCHLSHVTCRTSKNYFTFYFKKNNVFKKNPAAGRQRISRPMRIVAPPPRSF